MAEMVNFNLANPYQAQLDALARRQQMADIMAQQSLQPMQAPGTYNGIQAPISHLSGLAKILEGYTAGKEERAIKEEKQKLGETYRADQSSDFTNLARMLAAPAVAGQAEVFARQAEIAPEEMAQSADYGTPLPGAAIPAVQARIAGQIDPEMIGKFKTPETQQMAMAQLLAQIAPKTPIKASAGDVFFSPQGKELFRAPEKQEYGTNPQYEKDDKSPTGFVAVLYGKNGERKVVGPANPMNQYTTGTVDAALKRDMDMYQFGNLSAEQKVSLGIKLTKAGVDIARLGFETGQGPAPQPGLPPNAPVPNFGVQTRPPAMPQTATPQTVAPQVQPQVRPQTSPNVRPVQAVPTAQERPAGVTPKAWAEMQAKQAEAQLEKTKSAKTVVGLLTGVEDLIDQAHGGFFGNVYGGAKAALSLSDPANSADSQLNVIAGALTSQMPKMSGPQSDKDVLLYRQMAGDIGNPNISAEAKKAAVETVRGIQNAYINGFSETGYLPKGRASAGTIRNVEPPAGAVRRIK